jgi:DNA-binding XRE family transcriptional regulator
MTDKRNYAKEWKALRLKCDMSQTTFAEAVGTGMRTIQGIELGEHKPNFINRVRFKNFKKKIEQAVQ